MQVGSEGHWVHIKKWLSIKLLLYVNNQLSQPLNSLISI
jgi:hypothetical protein